MVEYTNYSNLKQQQHFFDFVDDTIVTFSSTAPMFHGNPVANILIEENICYSANNRYRF